MAIDLNALQELLNNAQNTASVEKEVRKSLTRIENLMANVTKEVTSIYELLDGAAPVKKERKARGGAAIDPNDTEAPYGRTKDGLPRKKPGRSKEAAAE
jgi:hypothetical protein